MADTIQPYKATRPEGSFYTGLPGLYHHLSVLQYVQYGIQTEAKYLQQRLEDSESQGIGEKGSRGAFIDAQSILVH